MIRPHSNSQDKQTKMTPKHTDSLLKPCYQPLAPLRHVISIVLTTHSEAIQCMAARACFVFSCVDHWLQVSSTCRNKAKCAELERTYTCGFVSIGEILTWVASFCPPLQKRHNPVLALSLRLSKQVWSSTRPFDGAAHEGLLRLHTCKAGQSKSCKMQT